MARPCDCPKCGADVRDSYEPEDPDCGIVAGWYCDTCDLAIPDEGYEDDSYD